MDLIEQLAAERAALDAELMDAATDIAGALQSLEEAEAHADRCRAALKLNDAELFLKASDYGVLTGSNEKTRTAQYEVWRMVSPEWRAAQTNAMEADNAVSKLKVDLQIASNALSIAKHRIDAMAAWMRLMSR